MEISSDSCIQLEGKWELTNQRGRHIDSFCFSKSSLNSLTEWGSCSWQNTFENVFHSDFRAWIVFSRLVVYCKDLCLWIYLEWACLDQASQLSDLQRIQRRFNGKPAITCMCENTVNNIRRYSFCRCCLIGTLPCRFTQMSQKTGLKTQFYPRFQKIQQFRNGKLIITLGKNVLVRNPTPHV